MVPPVDHSGFVSANAAFPSVTSSARTVSPATGATLTLARTVTPVSAPTFLTQLAPAHHIAPFHNDSSFGKGNGTVIVLFRSDLRLDDHPALAHAVEDAATVIPLYCFDPRHFGRTAHGFEKTGKYRARFLLDAVHDLRKSLQRKGSDLVVRTGHPEDILPAMCKKLGARAVFLHREVTYEEQLVEKALEKALREQGTELSSFWANTLYHEHDLPFDIGTMPDVYSDFRVAVEKGGTIRTPLPSPESVSRLPRGLQAGEIPTVSKLGIADTPSNPTTAGVSAITGGETEAMLRVRSYVDEGRRFDAKNSPRSKVSAHLGADFSCRISPWLALGCVSPRRIFDEMKKGAAEPKQLLRSTTYFELVWRDFFRYITAKYSSKRSNATRSAGGRKAMVRA